MIASQVNEFEDAAVIVAVFPMIEQAAAIGVGVAEQEYFAAMLRLRRKSSGRASRLMRYEASLQRAFERTLNHLERA